MTPSNIPDASLGSLLKDWLAVTGLTFRACAARAEQLLDDASERTKDTVLDLEICADESGRSGAAPGQPLPPLDPELFAAALRDRVEEVLRQTAEVINDDPSGRWAAVTQERVLALFYGLAQQAQVLALEQRVSAAEAGMPRKQALLMEWARRYRRMLAREGQWPPASEIDHAT